MGYYIVKLGNDENSVWTVGRCDGFGGFQWVVIDSEEYYSEELNPKYPFDCRIVEVGSKIEMPS